MTAVIQRVKYCKLSIDKKLHCEIENGLLLLLGIAAEDTEAELEKLCDKCDGLRIFEDENGKMNRSVNDIGGSVMVVPNFTLCADTRHGKRPSFTTSMNPTEAKPFFERFSERLAKTTKVVTGVFGADMKLELLNDGPVTLIIRSEDL